jgi:CubicO group peptidase (beta-lactamase class C family)
MGWGGMGGGFGGFGWGPYWGGGWGGWGGGFGGLGGFGGWGGGWNNEVYSVTNYNTVVAMRINRNADKKSVFEGRAETVSNSNNLTRLVPNLVTAMFTNFPGSSGETVRVRFDPAKPDVAPTVKPVR